ncbi:MAG: hypothetical protein BVN32_12120 [Proteobacteria bacterium ST_bin14]|nr:MAG: hypothetical protein BVN32_12120 [Proteobacteria bacterium ST_bin14]
MAYVAAQGEFRRYRGDYVLTEQDIRNHVRFNDTLIASDGSFCIHCAWEPGEGKYDFRLKDWIFDMRDKQSSEIPFRCLYSVNIDNLLMAGKHISVTHIAGPATKLMGKDAQHGVAVHPARHKPARAVARSLRGVDRVGDRAHRLGSRHGRASAGTKV